MPQSEIGDLIIELRSATAGVASYRATFDHMAELTGRLADEVMNASARQGGLSRDSVADCNIAHVPAREREDECRVDPAVQMRILDVAGIRSKRRWFPFTAARPGQSRSVWPRRNTFSSTAARSCKASGLGMVTAAALAASAEARTAAEDADPTADLYPAKKNEAYKLDRADHARRDQRPLQQFLRVRDAARTSPATRRTSSSGPGRSPSTAWSKSPFTIAFDDLVRKIPLETRLYRHRCVEAWSMTVPWAGFPLKSLVAMAKPQASAKFVRFETFLDPDMAGGQNNFLYPWPYVEGVTIEEAANDLAFIVTGAYDKPVAKQHGAPLRLHLPWKYGFKSIKSIRKISFVEERPVGLWEAHPALGIRFLGECEPRGAASALEPGDGAGAAHGRAGADAALQRLWRGSGRALCRNGPRDALHVIAA